VSASVLYMSMSLDGYIAGPNDEPGNPGGDRFIRLHEWYGEFTPPSGPRTPGVPIAFIGEAKYRDRRPGLAELRRLEHVASLLTAAGHDSSTATLGLFSGAGFTEDLVTEATRTDSLVG